MAKEKTSFKDTLMSDTNPSADNVELNDNFTLNQQAPHEFVEAHIPELVPPYEENLLNDDNTDQSEQNINETIVLENLPEVQTQIERCALKKLILRQLKGVLELNGSLLKETLIFWS